MNVRLEEKRNKIMEENKLKIFIVLREADYCEDDDYLNAKLWTNDGEYMSEINWDIDTIADMLFTEY